MAFIKTLKKHANTLFGKQIFNTGEAETAPTYRPELAESLKLLFEQTPSRDLTPLKALIKAYNTENPTAAQLKTICFGTDIFETAAANNAQLLEDEIERISELSVVARNYFETEYGRPSPISVEKAQFLLGTHADNDPAKNSYTDYLNNLATYLEEANECMETPSILPQNTIDKIKYASKAISDMAAGNTPDYEGLEGLVELRRRIRSIQVMASARKDNFVKLKEIANNANTLHAINYGEQNSHIVLLKTTNNLLANMGKKIKGTEYDDEPPEPNILSAL